MSNRRCVYISVASVAASLLINPQLAPADGRLLRGFDLERLGGISKQLENSLTSSAPDSCLPLVKALAERSDEGAIPAALCFLASGDFAKADTKARSVLETRRGSAPALYISALALYRLGKLTNSLTATNDALWFNRTPAVRVDYLKAHLIRVLRELQRHPQARETMARALSEHPGSVPLKREALQYAVLDGNRTLALTTARQILADDPEDVETRVLFSESLMRAVNFAFQRGDINEARESARRVISRSGAPPELRERAFLVDLDAAVGLQLNSDVEVALKQFEQEFPNNPRIASYRKQLTLADRWDSATESPNPSGKINYDELKGGGGRSNSN